MHVPATMCFSVCIPSIVLCYIVVKVFVSHSPSWCTTSPRRWGAACIAPMRLRCLPLMRLNGDGALMVGLLFFFF